MAEKKLLRRALSIAFAGSTAATLAVVGLTAPSAGCFTHKCDGNVDPTGSVYEGIEVDEDTVETTPINAPWLAFPGQRSWVITFPSKFFGRKIVSIDPYVSFAPDVTPQLDKAERETFAKAAGDMVEMSNIYDKGFTINNDTCSAFYLRVVVRFAQRANPGDGGSDASSDASLGPDTGPETGAE